MDSVREIKDNTGIKGTYTALALFRDLSPEEIPLAQRYAHGDRSVAHLLPLQAEHVVDNLTPDLGKNVLARLLCGDTTYSGAINYGALGSGTAAFSSSSTQLNTEVFRKLKVGEEVDGSTAYIDWYIASGDVANQTFNEFAAVIDGTGSANTGRPISLVLTGGWVKSGAVFITLSVTIL